MPLQRKWSGLLSFNFVESGPAKAMAQKASSAAVTALEVS
jgi:hypothetical protein